MPQAIDKMFIYFRNQRLEMFNDGISVPGRTLKYMFQDLPNYFTIPDKRNNDLHRLLKENIVGGPFSTNYKRLLLEVKLYASVSLKWSSIRMGNGPFPRNRRKLLKIERTKTSGKVVGYV
jgi:hypothetical protein